MKYCENCGEIRPDHLQFCTKCGTKLVERAEEVKAQESAVQAAPQMQAPQMSTGGMITCPNCGRAVPDTKKFCTGCGSMLTGAPKQASEPVVQQRQEAPVQQSAPFVQPEAKPAGPQQVPQQPSAQKPQPEKKMEGKKLGLLIAAIAVGALIVMGGSFLLTELLVFHTTPAEFFANLKGGKDADEELLLAVEDEEEKEEEPETDKEEQPKEKEKKEEKEEEEEIPEVEETPTPDPTPTEIVWEPLNFNVDEEQKEIDNWVKEHRQYKKNYKKHDFGDFTVYTQSDSPVIMWAKQGTNDWNYDREFHGVDDYYAELNDGYQAVSKFYYEGARLFRVIDDEGVHDYGDPDWEKFNDLGERLKEDRKRILEEYERKQ